MEAVPEGAMYSMDLPSNISHVTLPWQFLYGSTGVQTFFRDGRDPEPRSRLLKSGLQNHRES